MTATAVAEQLQIALAAALLADATFTAIGGTNVFDASDVQDLWPRTVLGEGHAVPTDTQFDRLSEAYPHLEFYARGDRCRLIAKRMADRAATVLAPPPPIDGSDPPAPFALPGHNLTTWCVQALDDLTEPDAKTARVRLTLCFQTQPTG